MTERITEDNEGGSDEQERLGKMLLDPSLSTHSSHSSFSCFFSYQSQKNSLILVSSVKQNEIAPSFCTSKGHFVRFSWANACRACCKG